MAIGMAIGLLFLGGGRLTIGTSKPAVAALLASLFPRFPSSPTDNRYHLQAFRHLYVLAAEARCIEAVDVDSGHSALVPLSVSLRNATAAAPPAAHEARATPTPAADASGASAMEVQPSVSASAASAATVGAVSKVTPCLLPPLRSISAVRVNGPRYWTRELHIASVPGHADVIRRRLLWVKRKTGHLAYILDPQGLSSIFCRQLPGRTGGSPHVKAFSSQPMLLAFSSHLCHAEPHHQPTDAADARGSSQTELRRELRSFCEAVLYECLAHEKAELIPVYMSLHHLARMLRHVTSSLPLHSARLLAAYYSSGGPARIARAADGDGAAPPAEAETAVGPPLQPAFVQSLLSTLDASFSSFGFDSMLAAPAADPAAKAAAGAGAAGGLCAEQLRVLYGGFLAFHGVPVPRTLPPSAPMGAEFLPFLLAHLTAQGEPYAAGGQRGLHAVALRMAAVGAAPTPWAE